MSGDGHVTDDVDPIIVTSLQEAMSTHQQQHDQEVKSIRDTLATQHMQHDAEMTSLKQQLMDLHDVMIERQKVLVTKQQHDVELTSLKREMTINQAKYDEGLCLFMYCIMYMYTCKYILLLCALTIYVIHDMLFNYIYYLFHMNEYCIW